MITKTTEGVKISVETVYQADYSNPSNEHFMFAYKILIENLGEKTVQLMNRHWIIFDSNGTHREVEGQGIVGQQPILASGQVHEYVSGCNLKTEIGSMTGTYEMRRVNDNSTFLVKIPSFTLITPYKLN
jgi:ApaG protein